MVIYRPHRGSLSDAMKEAIEFDSIEDMIEWICKDHNDSCNYFQITPEEIYISDYGSDERVDWHNCFICCYERPSKIKNFEGYKKYFGIVNEDDCDWVVNDQPVGVIGMFSTDYDRKVNCNEIC